MTEMQKRKLSNRLVDTLLVEEFMNTAKGFDLAAERARFWLLELATGGFDNTERIILEPARKLAETWAVNKL